MVIGIGQVAAATFLTFIVYPKRSNRPANKQTKNKIPLWRKKMADPQIYQSCLDISRCHSWMVRLRFVSHSVFAKTS